MYRLLLTTLSLVLAQALSAQNPLPDSCKLSLGTNLGGMYDYSTELAFVDLMHIARTWYTKDVDNPNGSPFNSEQADALSYRPDGYPTHIPQSVAGNPYMQEVATIWAITTAWPHGQYTLLYEGEGDFVLWNGHFNLTHHGQGRITFLLDSTDTGERPIELRITRSEQSNPIRNIRLLMPGTEQTYASQPFNQDWLDLVKRFGSVRFMDWGSTNNWGYSDWEDWDNPTETPWAERQQPDHYTYAHFKGVPYEYMIQLMNEHDLDGWVCVPHSASPDYIRQMARLFHDNLEPERTLTVEYSNEIWNWIFGQAHWISTYGEQQTGLAWPENTVHFIQRCLDIFVEEYGPDTARLRRVVGVHTGWQDVAERVI